MERHPSSIPVFFCCAGWDLKGFVAIPAITLAIRPCVGLGASQLKGGDNSFAVCQHSFYN